MQNVINTLGTALGLTVPVRPVAARVSQKAHTAYNVARIQWRDLREAVEQAVEPGLHAPSRTGMVYPGNRPGHTTVFYPAKTGEGLAGAFMAVARVESIGGTTWVNPDDRKVHIQVLSADVWSGEDTVAEFSGTVADLR